MPTATVPAYAAHAWEKVPHEHFDLSKTHPLPAIAPGANDDFYSISAKVGGVWKQRGYMWRFGGVSGLQEWYGNNLTHDLIGQGDDIRFVSVPPPAAGSEQVYLLE